MIKRIHLHFILNIVLCILAIFVPMYTVTTIVNGYYFSSSIFTIFTWHAYELVFTFFYLYIFWIFQKKRSSLSTTFLFMLLFSWEQVSFFLLENKLTLLLSHLPLQFFLIRRFLINSPNKIYFIIFLIFSLTRTGYFLIQNYRLEFSHDMFYFVGLIMTSFFCLILPRTYTYTSHNLKGIKFFQKFLILCWGVLFLDFFYQDLNYTKASWHLIFLGAISSIIAIDFLQRNESSQGNPRVRYAVLTSLAIGTAIRFTVPVFFPKSFLPSLHHSMGFWTLGYLILLIFIIRRQFHNS
ncbi:MAG: hypothetical protein QF441_08360 [Bacteriovoracaceae bacterium]|nr:hypothetical protein [Bacteriovoracaceae bacterium]